MYIIKADNFYLQLSAEVFESDITLQTHYDGNLHELAFENSFDQTYFKDFSEKLYKDFSKYL